MAAVRAVAAGAATSTAVVLVLAVLAMCFQPSLSQEDITGSAKCEYDTPLSTAGALPLDVKIYDVEGVCPKADYGVLHTDLCKKCAARSPGRDGSFVICAGCNEGNTCQDIEQYVLANAVVATAHKSARRLATESVTAGANITATQTYRQSEAIRARRLQGVSEASCSIGQLGSPKEISSYKNVRIDCSPCQGVPMNLDHCCSGCAKDARAGMNIAPNKIFYTCVGCENARSSDAKDYADRTEAMRAFLRNEIKGSATVCTFDEVSGAVHGGPHHVATLLLFIATIIAMR